MKTKLARSMNIKVGRVTPCAPQRCKTTTARRGLTRSTVIRQGVLLLLLSSLSSQLSAFAQGTAFTYQGRLNGGGAPATGIYDLRFTIYDSTNNPGVVIAGPITNSATGVNNGLFTATLDFGAGIFTGADRWLEVAVRTNGGGAYTTLTPRQQLTPTPYAISAGNLSGALRVELNTNGGPNLIGGSPANQVDAGVQGATISGGGTLNYFGFPYTNRVSADFGAIGGGIANLAQSFGSFIGGGYGNTVEPGLGHYSAIVGGALNRIRSDASDSFIAGGDGNVIGNGVSYASIGGGYLNTNASSYSVIAGGQYNTTEPLTDSSAIGGGWLNVIQSGADQSVIAGGNANGIQTGARESFIGGGFANTIQSNAAFSFIGAGTGNVIGSNSVWGTIAGGQQNSIQSNSPSATIGGGQNNLIQPYGQYGTIGGGGGNVAGFLSTVSGGQGNAISNAAFGTIAGGVANGIAYAVQYGTIGGGHLNQISQFAHGSTIAGGWSNSILFNVQIAAIGGGFGNVIRTGGDYSSIGGGQFNTNGGYISLISGGQNNTIAPLADHSVIGGGGDNRIIGSLASAVYATISGGQSNSIQANVIYSTISGGLANTVQSNAQYATIPGGASNSVAGNYGLAAGRRAKANHAGAFVWADTTDADFASTASNQFNVRATGGVRLETRGAGATIDGLPLLSGVVPSSSIAGSYASAVTFNNPANSFAGNGGGLTNVNAATLGGLASSSFWKTTGNTGTTPAANFLGTTDNQPLEIKVNNARALRLEPIVNSTALSNLVNFVGGSSANYVAPFRVGATIAGGGGALYGTATNIPNRVLGDFGSIGGGVNNSCGFGATVAGGTANQASGDDSSIGGGFQNFAQAYAATVAGGTVNFGTGGRSTVGGGEQNISSGSYSTIPGGYQNTASASYSFAAGRRAQATNDGAFVWADSQDANFYSTTNDQFSIRAQNGVRLNTDTSLFWGSGAKLWPDQGGAIELGDSRIAGAIPYIDFHYGVGADQDYNVRIINDGDGQLTLSGNQRITGSLGFGIQTRQMLNLFGAAYGIGVQNFRLYFRTDAPAGFAWFAGGTHSDTTDSPGSGGTELMKLESNGNLSIRGVIAQNVVLSSDRNVKAGFEPMDSKAILEKVAALPITRWHYTNDLATPHLGPMAQDFHAAFGVGPDDKHIATVDADGVALAAIQGLNQKLEEQLARKDGEIRELKAAVADLTQMISKLNLPTQPPSR